MRRIKSFIRRHRRSMTSVLLVLVGLIVCIIILGFIPFSNTALKNKAEQLLKESLSGQCTIGTLKVTLWNGVIIQDVHYNSYDKGKGAPTLSCTIPRITISYFLVPLLFKHLIINTIELDHPDITTNLPAQDSRKDKPSEAFSMAAFSRVLATIPYTILVRKISISDAHASIGQNGAEFFGGKGIDFSMKVGLHRELTLDGRLGASEMMLLRTFKLTSAKASVRVKGPNVSLYDCRASVYGGELLLQGNADLYKSVIHSFNLSLSDLKLEEWQRESGSGKGEVTGKIKAAVDFDEGALSVDSLRGKGWIRASAVSARRTSLQNSLVLRLAIPKLEILKFSTIYTDLTIRNSKITTKNFRGKGDPLDFSADGWLDFKGRFSEKIDGVFSADFSRSLPDIVRNSLLPVEGNADKRSFKCTLGGTIDNPQLEVDERIVNRAMNNVFDAIGKSLGNLFKR